MHGNGSPSERKYGGTSVAKDKKSDAQKDGCTRVRTSIGLPSEWMHVFQHLSTSRSKDLGELVQGFLEREFATLPRAESEAIRTLVRLATGKTLRLSGVGGPTVAESVPPESAGEGIGGEPAEVVISANRVNPLNRMSAISAIHKRTTGDPTDAAISGSYEIESLTR
jgi:hypothetical protein